MVFPLSLRCCRVVWCCRDLTNGQCRVTCSHEDAVTHVEWAPNGEPYVFSSSVDKTLKSGSASADSVDHACSKMYARACRSFVVFARSHFSFLVPCACVVSCRMWDARSGECLRTWKGHSDAVLGFRVTADASTLVSGSDDHTALVFKR